MPKIELDKSYRPPPVANTKQGKAVELMVAGNTPSQSAKEAGTNLEGIRNQLAKPGVTERNRHNFEQIGLNFLRPYEVLKEALEAESPYTVYEVIDELVEGRDGQMKATTKSVGHTEYGPDHNTRLKASQIITGLLGEDPRLQAKIGIVTEGGNTEVRAFIGDMYISIANMQGGGEEAKIEALNAVERAAKNGDIILDAEYSLDE